LSSAAAPPAPEPKDTSHGSRLFRASSTVSLMTMISRVLGLLRDVCIGVVVGDSAAGDAFFIAFKVPQFLRRLFSEGAFSQAFVPVLSEYRVKGTRESVLALVNRVSGCLAIVLLCVVVPIMVFSPFFTMLFAPGFYLHHPETFGLASQLVRITFPYLLLISLTGFAGGILNSYDRFSVPAFTPVLLNVSLIFAALVMTHWFEHPVYALAWGVLLAGVAQFAFQLPFLARIGMMPKPQVDFQHEGVKRILALMLPALFGVSVGQINLFLDTIIASFLPEGSVSRLYYADRLYELPLGVFAIAVSTVILPSLSRDFARQDHAKFSAKLDWSLRAMMLLSVPAAFALIVIAKPILSTLFFYGKKMSEQGIQVSAYCLQAYSLGLLAFMLIKVLVPGYYARQDMKTPVKIGIISMVSNMVLNLIIVTPLHFYFNMGVVGLAAASTLAAFINMGLLLKGLIDKGIYQAAPGWKTLMLRMTGASVAMCLVLWGLMQVQTGWTVWPWYERVLNLTAMVSAGLLTYVGVLFASGLRWSDFHVDME